MTQTPALAGVFALVALTAGQPFSRLAVHEQPLNNCSVSTL